MKRILLLLLLTSSLHAQTAVTAWLSMQRNGGGGDFPHPTRDLTVGRVYIGAGAAYVTVDDVDTTVIDSETTGVLGAGVTYDFTPRWGVGLDPLIVSAGVRVRF